MGILRSVMAGATAGAAGTTGLNAATFVDMAGRGRPSSSAPEDTVERLVDISPLSLPGEGDTRTNRLTGLGSLNGTAVGVGVGAGLGGLRGAGWRPGLVTTAILASAVAMAVTDAVMAALKVTDPRDWSAKDWVADIVPHLVYGFVTAATLLAADEAKP